MFNEAIRKLMIMGYIPVHHTTRNSQVTYFVHNKDYDTTEWAFYSSFRRDSMSAFTYCHKTNTWLKNRTGQTEFKLTDTEKVLYGRI